MTWRNLSRAVLPAVLLFAVQGVRAQSVNHWRGDETRADWNDAFKWRLKRPPTGNESVHFREPNSVVAINSTIHLNNGILLFGKELSLVGNGNLNLLNPVPHQSSVNIPGSASGYANLTLNDNVSINARIALAATEFGTSASKGSITLNDRATLTGVLAIGKSGTGTGQVFVRDNATYRITGLELDTRAKDGGSAQIQVTGGTVRIETVENPFDIFLEDPSRQIILGDAGILRIESAIPAARKKELIKAMISQKRLVAASGCRLVKPVFDNRMFIARAEDERNESEIRDVQSLLAAIDRMPVPAEKPAAAGRDSLASAAAAGSAPAVAPGDGAAAGKKGPQRGAAGAGRLAGYIVFMGALLLVLRRPTADEGERPQAA